MNTKQLFVYGTLMAGFENYSRYLKAWVKKIFPATVKGELFHLPEGYPALVEGNGTVRGELMIIPELKGIIDKLDDLEDYHGEGMDNLYERVIMPVEIQSTGVGTEAYVYIFCDSKYARRKGIPVPDGDWRKFVAIKH